MEPTVVYGVEGCRVVVSGIEVEGRWNNEAFNFAATSCQLCV